MDHWTCVALLRYTILEFFRNLLGGFQLWDGWFDNVNFYYCNTMGSQLFTGPENAPTLLTGNFSLTDAQDNTDSWLGTGTLNCTTVPEPSALVLMAMGLAFGAAIFALRKN